MPPFEQLYHLKVLIRVRWLPPTSHITVIVLELMTHPSPTNALKKVVLPWALCKLSNATLFKDFTVTSISSHIISLLALAPTGPVGHRRRHRRRFSRCIFAKCTRLTHLLCFVSLFHVSSSECTIKLVVISIVLMSQESVMFWFLKSQYLKRKSILQRKCFVLRNIIRIVTRTLWRPKCGAWEGLMPPSVGVLLVAVCLLLTFRVKCLTNLFVSDLLNHLCTKRWAIMSFESVKHGKMTSWYMCQYSIPYQAIWLARQSELCRAAVGGDKIPNKIGVSFTWK